MTNSEKITLGTGVNEKIFTVNTLVTENFESEASFRENWLIEETNSTISFVVQMNCFVSPSPEKS